jgi:hypothetical protein
MIIVVEGIRAAVKPIWRLSFTSHVSYPRSLSGARRNKDLSAYRAAYLSKDDRDPAQKAVTKDARYQPKRMGASF